METPAERTTISPASTIPNAFAAILANYIISSVFSVWSILAGKTLHESANCLNVVSSGVTAIIIDSGLRYVTMRAAYLDVCSSVLDCGRQFWPCGEDGVGESRPIIKSHTEKS